MTCVPCSSAVFSTPDAGLNVAKTRIFGDNVDYPRLVGLKKIEVAESRNSLDQTLGKDKANLVHVILHLCYVEAQYLRPNDRAYARCRKFSKMALGALRRGCY